MSSPRKIHEVQQLTRWVVALNRFVSKSADKCFPFLKILRKNKSFEWMDKSEVAFQQLKEYLGSPPLLTVPNMGEDFILYLSFLPTAVSVVLIRKKDKVQKLVYYVSKVLIGVKTKYLKISSMYVGSNTVRPNFASSKGLCTSGLSRDHSEMSPIWGSELCIQRDSWRHLQQSLRSQITG